MYSEPTAWLCHPDLPASTDVCRRDLDATAVRADGTTEVQPHIAASDPKIDCFYVYPTVSRDTTPNSDMSPAEGEEILAAVNQVARLNSQCRVFAPVYRQIPLTGLFGGGSTAAPTTDGTPREIAYGDVRDAFKEYMANHNDGRGVVLVGHSQGSGHLNRLIREEIDGNESLRGQLVSAYLLGGSVSVPEGADVGGEFQNVPACRQRDQTGCVVTYASFRSTAPPPPDSLFGRPRAGGGQSLCVNPAALGGGSATMHPYFPTRATGVVGGAAEAVPDVATPFVTYPDLITAQCVHRDGFTWLEVTIPDAGTDARGGRVKGDLSPPWGLHLIDANLAMGDIESLVAEQATAYAG